MAQAQRLTLMDELPPVNRGASPSKSLLTVDRAIEAALETVGKKVLYSTGHTKHGGRAKANDIRIGKRGPWRPYTGLISTSCTKEEDGTYSVYVYVHPEDYERWYLNLDLVF